MSSELGLVSVEGCRLRSNTFLVWGRATGAPSPSRTSSSKTIHKCKLLASSAEFELKFESERLLLAVVADCQGPFD